MPLDVAVVFQEYVLAPLATTVPVCRGQTDDPVTEITGFGINVTAVVLLATHKFESAAVTV
jgi:hypothetical protein